MLSVWFLFGLADQGLAAIPPTLNFQGYLTSTAGMPIQGSVAMSFSIYAQESESDFFLHCFFGILVKNARFQQLLINEVKILPQGFLGSADCGPTYHPTDQPQTP
jgi:hypothetical protein